MARHAYHRLSEKALREGKSMKEISREYRARNLQVFGNPISPEGLRRHRRAATVGALLSRDVDFHKALATAQSKRITVPSSEPRPLARRTGLLERLEANPSGDLWFYVALAGGVLGALALWRAQNGSASPAPSTSDPFYVDGQRWPAGTQPVSAPIAPEPGVIWPY